MVISYARGAPTAHGYGTQEDTSNSTSLSGRNHKLPIPFRDPGVTSSGVQGVAGQIQQGSRANHPQGDQDLPPSNEPPPIQQRISIQQGDKNISSGMPEANFLGLQDLSQGFVPIMSPEANSHSHGDQERRGAGGSFS